MLIGAFALGQAGPNMEALFTAAGAAGSIFETIDRVSDYTIILRIIFSLVVRQLRKGIGLCIIFPNVPKGCVSLPIVHA